VAWGHLEVWAAPRATEVQSHNLKEGTVGVSVHVFLLQPEHSPTGHDHHWDLMGPEPPRRLTAGVTREGSSVGRQGRMEKDVGQEYERQQLSGSPHQDRSLQQKHWKLWQR
jgi:hypothetical protein